MKRICVYFDPTSTEEEMVQALKDSGVEDPQNVMHKMFVVVENDDQVFPLCTELSLQTIIHVAEVEILHQTS